MTERELKQAQQDFDRLRWIQLIIREDLFTASDAPLPGGLMRLEFGLGKSEVRIPVSTVLHCLRIEQRDLMSRLNAVGVDVPREMWPAAEEQLHA